MPHFRLMDADELGPEKSALQRARLHIRAGKRRLRQGKLSAGIVTLYDALDQALGWYLLAGSRRGEITVPPAKRTNSRFLYEALCRADILDGSFDYDVFDSLTERCLHEELENYDCRGLVVSLDAVMTALGVMPFDESDLPREDPATF